MLANHLFFHQSLLPCRHLDEQRELPFNLAAIGSRSAVSSGLKIATKRSLNKHHPFWGVIIVTHKRSGWTSENHPGKDHIRKPYWCLQSKGPYQSFDDGELFQEIFMPVSTHSVSVGHRELQPRHMHGNRWQFLLLQGPLADHLNKGSKIRDLATQGPTFLDFLPGFLLSKKSPPLPTSAPVHQAFPGTCSSDAGDRRSSVDGLVRRASHTPPRAATQASLKRENCLGSSHLLRMENRKGTTSWFGLTTQYLDCITIKMCLKYIPNHCQIINFVGKSGSFNQFLVKKLVEYGRILETSLNPWSWSFSRFE